MHCKEQEGMRKAFHQGTQSLSASHTAFSQKTKDEGRLPKRRNSVAPIGNLKKNNVAYALSIFICFLKANQP